MRSRASWPSTATSGAPFRAAMPRYEFSIPRLRCMPIERAAHGSAAFWPNEANRQWPAVRPNEANSDRSTARPNEASKDRSTARPNEASKDRSTARPNEANKDRSTARRNEANRTGPPAWPNEANSDRSTARPNEANSHRSKAWPNEAIRNRSTRGQTKPTEKLWANEANGDSHTRYALINHALERRPTARPNEASSDRSFANGRRVRLAVGLVPGEAFARIIARIVKCRAPERPICYSAPGDRKRQGHP